MLGEKQTRLVKRYTGNLEVYNLYLKGRHYWNKREKDDLLQSIEFFQEGVNKDPSYALGYSGMGMAYVALGANNHLPAAEVLPKAKEAALKALEIDQGLDEAHVILGAVLNWYEHNFAASEKELMRAIELNPSNADAHHWYAWLLINLSRNEEAINEMLLARDLDPLAPRKNADVGQVLLCARQGTLGSCFARHDAPIPPQKRGQPEAGRQQDEHLGQPRTSLGRHGQENRLVR